MPDQPWAPITWASPNLIIRALVVQALPPGVQLFDRLALLPWAPITWTQSPTPQAAPAPGAQLYDRRPDQPWLGATWTQSPTPQAFRLPGRSLYDRTPDQPWIPFTWTQSPIPRAFVLPGRALYDRFLDQPWLGATWTQSPVPLAFRLPGRWLFDRWLDQPWLGQTSAQNLLETTLRIIPGPLPIGVQLYDRRPDQPWTPFTWALWHFPPPPPPLPPPFSIEASLSQLIDAQPSIYFSGGFGSTVNKAAFAVRVKTGADLPLYITNETLMAPLLASPERRRDLPPDVRPPQWGVAVAGAFLFDFSQTIPEDDGIVVAMMTVSAKSIILSQFVSFVTVSPISGIHRQAAWCPMDPNADTYNCVIVSVSGRTRASTITVTSYGMFRIGVQPRSIAGDGQFYLVI